MAYDAASDSSGSWSEAPSLRAGGVEIPYISRVEAIEAIDRSIDDRRQISVAFCNANTLLRAFDSPDYARILSRFLVLNDGVGVDICSRIVNGRPFTENLNGTDFVPALLSTSRHPLKIFMLGARPGVAQAASQVLVEAFPRHRVVGCRHGYFSAVEIPQIVAEINLAKPDLVLVALGNPRQEEFVAAQGASLDAQAIVMVGALFDFLAGEVVRAPRIVRLFRAEWLFRLAQEPRRLGKRYTVDVVRFLAKVLWLRVKRSSGAIETSSGAEWRTRL